MIDRFEIERSAAMRNASENLDVMIFTRFVLGEEIEENVDVTAVIRHVDHIAKRVPTIPRIRLSWIVVKGWQVVKKCRVSCSELTKAGSPWAMMFPILRASLAMGALGLLCCRITLGHRIISSRCTLIPVARYLYQ